MIHFWIHTGGLLDLVAFQFLVFSLEGLDHFKQLRLRLLGFGDESPVDNISFRTTSLHSDAAAMWILEKLLKELASVLLLAILGMRLEVVVYASKVLKSWDSRNFLALALDGSEQAGEAEEFELSVLRSYKVGREGENQSFSSKREKTGGETDSLTCVELEFPFKRTLWHCCFPPATGKVVGILVLDISGCSLSLLKSFKRGNLHIQHRKLVGPSASSLLGRSVSVSVSVFGCGSTSGKRVVLAALHLSLGWLCAGVSIFSADIRKSSFSFSFSLFVFSFISLSLSLSLSHTYYGALIPLFTSLFFFFFLALS